MYAHCADPDVLGAPFYVMERVDGVAMRRATELEARGPERTAAITKDLVDVLARLHAVDPDEVGLSEFGRPVGFLERQVRRWGQQLEGSKTQERPRPRSCTAGSPTPRPPSARTRPRSGSCTATTGSTTAWSATTTGSTPWSTGRWPRSATPAPTSP